MIMKLNASLNVFAVLSMLSTQAFADVICTANAVSNNQEVPCSSFQLPEGMAGSTTLSCNGYQITVFCDLYHTPNKMDLSIAGPQGSTASTSTENELRLVDSNGDGAAIRCETQ
jgi:hypothetical protein